MSLSCCAEMILICGRSLFLKIVQTIGATTADKRLVYQVTEEEKSSIRQKLTHFSFEGDPSVAPQDDKIKLPIVVFQLGGGRRSSWRDWSIENYAKLAAEFL